MREVFQKERVARFKASDECEEVQLPVAATLSCSCIRCYQWCACGHNVLFGMMLNAARVVPEKLERISPSLRKLCTGSRAVADSKRKPLLARIEWEKKSRIKKYKGRM